MNFGVRISKIEVQIRNLHFQDTKCVNFQLKRTALTFLAQICPRRKLGFEIRKTNVGIRINIFEIPCVPIFRQNGQLWIFGSKFAQKWILVYMHQFSDKTDNFEFLGLNLPKNGFWGGNFKNLSLDLESAPPIYHASQF